MEPTAKIIIVNFVGKIKSKNSPWIRIYLLISSCAWSWCTWRRWCWIWRICTARIGLTISSSIRPRSRAVRKLQECGEFSAFLGQRAVVAYLKGLRWDVFRFGDVIRTCELLRMNRLLITFDSIPMARRRRRQYFWKMILDHDSRSIISWLLSRIECFTTFSVLFRIPCSSHNPALCICLMLSCSTAPNSILAVNTYFCFTLTSAFQCLLMLIF